MKTLSKCSLTLVCLVAAVLSARVATAQPAAAQAEYLFREGKRLMSEGNIAAACDSFEGSFKKDPAVSTLLNLADCREKNQQYASAWGYFVEAARLAKGKPETEALRKTAQDRAGALEARLSFLIINVPNEAQLEGLAITRNGVPVEQVEWNRDIPVDGGDYRIEGKAPGFEAWSTTIHVGNAKDKQSVNVPRFRQALTSPPGGEPVRNDDRQPSFTNKRKAAVGLWALGAVALGGAVALEFKSGSTYDDAKAATDNADRHDLTDTANRQRGMAIAAAGVGAAAISVGVFLWVNGKPSEKRDIAFAPQVGPDQAGLSLLGRF